MRRRRNLSRLIQNAQWASYLSLCSVNFKKMMPKAGVFKSSEVFQVLNDEQLKSKAEKELEDKYQWTTFLQKPMRPPPQRTLQPACTNTYKPTIVKQPKPKCAPDYRAPTPVSLDASHLPNHLNDSEMLFRKCLKFKFKKHNKASVPLRSSKKKSSSNAKFKSKSNAKAMSLRFPRKLSSL